MCESLPELKQPSRERTLLRAAQLWRPFSAEASERSVWLQWASVAAGLVFSFSDFD